MSRLEEVEALAARTIDAFGAVHVVCNNAGVESGATFADIPAETWDWVLGVDLLGTIYGIKTFLPLLREHAPDGHIVNTSSIAGLDSYFLTAAPTSRRSTRSSASARSSSTSSPPATSGSASPCCAPG